MVKDALYTLYIYECEVLLQHLNDQDLQEQRNIFLNFLLPEPNYSQARILRDQQAPTLLSVSPVSPLIGNPTIHRHPTHNKHEFDSPAVNITNIPHMYHLEKAEQRHHKPNHTPQMTITFVPNKLNSIQPTQFEIQVVNKAEFLIWMYHQEISLTTQIFRPNFPLGAPTTVSTFSP